MATMSSSSAPASTTPPAATRAAWSRSSRKLTAGVFTIDAADLKVLGAAEGDHVGREIVVGDIDHDGLPDLLYSAHHANENGELHGLLGTQL